jgi:quercetin dioxygenase-like cupin family protein
MKVVARHTDVLPTVVELEGAKDITKRVVLGPADGTPRMALRVFTVAPGGHTPYHGHPYEHMNVVLAGTGVVRTPTGDIPVGPGAMALILPDEIHQFRNIGDQPLEVVCLVPNEFA